MTSCLSGLSALKTTPLLEDTHKLAVTVGYQDVHLRALGADDLAAQRLLAQVDMATVRLVDGDGGDLPHDLHADRRQN